MLLIFVMAASCAFAQGEEPVKCKSGTLVAPIGDLQAEAPDIEAEAAAMYSLDWICSSSCMKRMRTRGLNHTAPPSF